jgi:hypothetical protein
MRLTNHVTLNFNNNTAAVFLDTNKPLIQHATLVCYIFYLKIRIFDQNNQAYLVFPLN